jgi:hypothetical protein
MVFRLRPAVTDDNPAALIIGLGSGERGPFKDSPSASAGSEGESAVSIPR